jgi:hypothetical protein
MRLSRGILLTAILLAPAILLDGCLTLRSARSTGRGVWALRAQSAFIAPPPYLGALSLTRGMTPDGDLTLSLAGLAGARDEPGADLEWFQALPDGIRIGRWALPEPLHFGVGIGVGTYVLDPGVFLHTSQVLSLDLGRFSPLLLHRLTYDLDDRTRQEGYLGLEWNSGRSLRLYLAAGARDLWNRDEWVVVCGLGWRLGGGR